MAIKSSTDTQVAEKPERLAIASTAKLKVDLANLETLLETLVKRRKNLGEFNVDSGDILIIAQALLALVQRIRDTLSLLDLGQRI